MIPVILFVLGLILGGGFVLYTIEQIHDIEDKIRDAGL